MNGRNLSWLLLLPTSAPSGATLTSPAATPLRACGRPFRKLADRLEIGCSFHGDLETLPYYQNVDATADKLLTGGVELEYQ